MLHSTDKSRVDSLAKSFNDTSYTKTVIPNSNQAITEALVSAKVACDKDYDFTHPAGSDLGDMVLILATSPFKVPYAVPARSRLLPSRLCNSLRSRGSPVSVASLAKIRALSASSDAVSGASSGGQGGKSISRLAGGLIIGGGSLVVA